MQVIHTFGVIDVETTGLDPHTDQIIEFGLMVVQFVQDRKGKMLQEIGRYEGRRDPGFPIPKDVTKVHKIKDKHVKGKNLDIDYIMNLLSRCDFLVAHNAVYDKGFVTNLIPSTRKMAWLCSMKGIDWRGLGHSSRSLATLAKHYRTPTKPDHSALSDVAAVSYLLMVQNDGLTLLEELVDSSERWLSKAVVDRNNGIYEQREETVKEIAITETPILKNIQIEAKGQSNELLSEGRTMKVTLKHYASGHEIKCKKGFSWTTLFFSFFVPLIRGDLRWFIIMLITDIFVGAITFGLGLFVPWLIFAFIYNNRYIRDLGKKGYLEVHGYYSYDEPLAPG